MLLIRAFARLRTQRPARLMILGEGELRPDLEALTRELGLGAEALGLPGFLKKPDSYMQCAKLFGFPLPGRDSATYWSNP